MASTVSDAWQMEGRKSKCTSRQKATKETEIHPARCRFPNLDSLGYLLFKSSVSIKHFDWMPIGIFEICTRSRVCFELRFDILCQQVRFQID